MSTNWELDAKEQAELSAIFPRAAGVTQVEIGRNYKAIRTVGFQNLKPIAFSASEIAARIRKIQPVAEVEIEKLDAAVQPPAKSALTQFAAGLALAASPTQWATNAAPALAAFRKALAVAAVTLPDREEGLVSELEEIVSQIAKDGPARQEARTWAVGKLPIFVYVDEYPELTGHQNIAEYLTRKVANPSQLTDADRNFEKMCKVADLSPEQLHQLHGANDHETRNQLANRASAIVTSELRRLWKDRQLRVRFSPDANHLDTFIADPNSVYDVEVNLNERSRGLKCFFRSISRLRRTPRAERRKTRSCCSMRTSQQTTRTEQRSAEEVLLSTIDATADDKLTRFALRLALAGHVGIPREGEFDFLSEAGATFVPPPTKKKAAGKMAKQPTPIESPAKAKIKPTTQKATSSKKTIAA